MQASFFANAQIRFAPMSGIQCEGMLLKSICCIRVGLSADRDCAEETGAGRSAWQNYKGRDLQNRPILEEMRSNYSTSLQLPPATNEPTSQVVDVK